LPTMKLAAPLLIAMAIQWTIIAIVKTFTTHNNGQKRQMMIAIRPRFAQLKVILAQLTQSLLLTAKKFASSTPFKINKSGKMDPSTTALPMPTLAAT